MPEPKSASRTFKFVDLPYYSWKVVPDEDGVDRKRPFVIVVAPFWHIRRWLYVEPYDSVKQTGWQRHTSEVHSKKLAKDMAADAYTPTTWTASADDWHMKKLIYQPKDDGYHQLVTLTVSLDHRLRLTDGGHRFDSLKRLHEDAKAKGDVARRTLIDNTSIDIKVLLSPEHIHSDFVNLQKGKAVPLNLIKSLEMADGDMSPERLERLKFATAVARIADEDPASHLFHQVAFDVQSRNLPIQYSSLVADHASSLATTLYGGAAIALKYGKTPEWTARRYSEVYSTLGDYRDDDGSRVLFKTGRKLAPRNLGGTKGGTHLLIGLGNALIWRLASTGVEDDGIAAELEHLSYIACKMFEVGSSGGSATEKRADMNRFSRAYFRDMDGVECVDGVPVELIRTTSASSWGVRSQVYTAWKKKNPDDARAPAAEEQGGDDPSDDEDRQED